MDAGRIEEILIIVLDAVLGILKSIKKLRGLKKEIKPKITE